MRDLPRRCLPALLFTLFAAPALLVAQSRAPTLPEALIGTWRLDLAKSKYSPGPPPRSETRTYERDPAGVKGTIDRTYADGRREVIEYRADADHDSPVSGTRAYDTARFKQVDTNTTEAVLSHAGRVYGFARRIISPDGETLIITFRREERGDMVNNMAVYTKERP